MIDLAGVHEVAEYLRWSKQRVSVRRERGRFAEPVAVLQMGPIWRLSDVRQWALSLPTDDPLSVELSFLTEPPQSREGE